MHLEPGIAVDRYVVEGLLGRGGVASVYRVRHTGLGTVHALKVVHVPSPSVTERLLREGRVQGRLRHPNVVSITDLVSVRGAPGLIMELVPGPSLDRFLERVTLALDEADHLARGILAGVAAAHRLGLVHRDLKPGNVLIEVSDGEVIPKIVDFGLAKVLEAPSESPLETRAGSSLGTPAYMAPEQMDDASTVDERADVFALGSILVELVTGRRAFAGDTVAAVRAAIRAGDYGALPAGLPDRMADAIRAALAVDPAQRIGSVEALAAIWSAGTPPPRVVWSELLLDAARLPAGEVSVGEPSPSTSTIGTTEKSLADPTTHRTTQETWADPNAAAGLDADVAPARSVARWAVAGVGLAALAVGAWWWSRPEPVVELGPGRIPVVSADPSVQGQFEAAFAAFLQGDFDQTERRLGPVREASPDVPLPFVLASTNELLLGDVPTALTTVAHARSLVAAGATGPSTELVKVLQVLQEQGNPKMGDALWAHIQAHPDDWLARFIAAQNCSNDAEVAVCERAHAALLEQGEDHPGVWIAISRSWLDLGERERARTAAEAGLRLDPVHPVLLALLGGAALADADLPRAKRHYEKVLTVDPRSWSARVALAQVALMADDGSYDAVTRELLVPTVPVADRVSLLSEAAETLYGLGRVSEALATVDVMVALEESHGSPLGVVTALGKRGEGLHQRGDAASVLAMIDRQLLVISGAPEIPNPVRNRFASYRPLAEGLLAAKAGDRAGLAARLERALGAEDPQASVIATLRRELGVIDRDEAAIAATGATFWTACDREATLGQAYFRAGLADAAARAWEATLASPCRLHRPERARRVAALVGLAEHARGRGDAARAEALTAEAERLWPRPDPDLPLTQRLRALRDPAEGG